MPCSWRVVQAQLQDQRVSRSTSIPSHPWPHCHTHCHRSAQFCHAPPSSRPIFAASTQSYPPCVASPSAMVCRLPDACRGGHRFPRRYRGLMFGRATVTALVILSMQSAPRAQLAVAAKQQKIPDVKLPLLILSDEAVGDRSRRPQPAWPAFAATVPSVWFGGPVPETPEALRSIARYSAAFLASQVRPVCRGYLANPALSCMNGSV